MIDNKDILKEIIPNKLTDDIDNNIKLIKRKLNIYNLKYNTNYLLEDIGINILYNKEVEITSLFYNYKELNENFSSEKIELYKENYIEGSKFLKDEIKGCKIYEKKENPNSIFLFKGDKFILEQDFKNRIFWLSYPLIWSKFNSDFGYKWLEVSNLCNGLLEQGFKQGGFTTEDLFYKNENFLEHSFKKGEFATCVNPYSYSKEFEESFKQDRFTTFKNTI